VGRYRYLDAGHIRLSRGRVSNRMYLVDGTEQRAWSEPLVVVQ
jgi:hypothetical protein